MPKFPQQMLFTTFFNPLSAILQIYPSSKWWSQWVYDGYIRHGWITRCGRGRDSASLECLGETIEGRFSFEARTYLFSFQSFVRFEEFCFFPRFWKSLAPNVQALELLVSKMSWRSFWKLRSINRHFLQTLTTTMSIFWKSRCYLPDSYGDPRAEQSTLVIVSRKLEWKLDFRALVRSSAEGPSIGVVIGTSRVRWSVV